MPLVFSDQDQFLSWFSVLNWDPAKKAARDLNIQEIATKKELEKALHTLIRPFLLRRTKEEVLSDSIPPKREVMIELELTDLQRELYFNVLTRNADRLEKVIDDVKSSSSSSSSSSPSSSVRKNSISLQNIMIQLRKCCNHPYLFDGIEPTFNGEYEIGDHIVESSCKLSILDLLLPKMKEKGYKVLIFSQMTRMLDIVQDYLQYRSYAYERLDGSVRSEERFIAMKKFTDNEESFVFLLSTRAGGVGLNLTSANVVIFLDHDWNPQQDRQAEARVHRLGQKKPVLIFKLVCRFTVEEVIVRSAKKKLQLQQTVIEQGGFSMLDSDDDDEPKNSEMIMSAIKFGLSKLQNEGTKEAMTEKDLELIINNAFDTDFASKLAAVASHFHVETVANSAPIPNDSMSEGEKACDEPTLYEFGEMLMPHRHSMSESNQEDENQDTMALQSLLQKANKKTKTQTTGADSNRSTRTRTSLSSPSSPTPSLSIKKTTASAEEKRLRLWKKNNYQSSKIHFSESEDESDDPEDSKGLLSNIDEDSDLLEFVIGDVTRPIRSHHSEPALIVW